MKYMSNDVFEQIATKYRCNPTENNGKELGEAFDILFENIVKIFGAGNLVGSIVKNSKKDIIFSCFDRVEKFDPDKGNAYSYFATIVLNQMRKTYLTYKNRLEKEKKYGTYVGSLSC